MTAPPPDDHDPSQVPDPPLDEERLAALRALLRDEPIEIDAKATDARIRAALEAAGTTAPGTATSAGSTPLIAGQPGEHRRTTSPPPPTRSHRATRPLLVAAAVLAVLGVGAVVWSTADRDAEFLASAGDADSEASAARAADDSAGGSDLEDGATESAGPTSTLAPPTAAALDAGTLADLGRFDSVDDLLRQVPAVPTESPGAGGADGFVPASGAALECVATRAAAGEVVLGTATVGADTVLVVEVQGAPLLYDLPACRPRG
jgi:hypothetical protein